MLGNFLSLYFPNGQALGAESPETIVCLSMLFFGYCAPEHLEETCRRTRVTGKIPIDVSVAGETTALGRNYLKRSWTSRTLNG